MLKVNDTYRMTRLIRIRLEIRGGWPHTSVPAVVFVQ
jgi:hypothetical protein